MTINLVFNPAVIDFIVALNVISVIGHAVFLLFGWPIFKLGKITMLLIITLISLFGFIVSFNITNKNRDWVTYNLSVAPKRVDTRTNREIEVDSQTEYDNQLRSEGRDPNSVKQYENK